MRITGDCPFVDASIIDNAVKLIKEKKCDYLSNTLDRTYPDGIDVEVFSNAALNKAHKEAKHSFLREHVTPYIHGHTPKGINSGIFNKIPRAKIIEVFEKIANQIN